MKTLRDQTERLFGWFVRAMGLILLFLVIASIFTTGEAMKREAISATIRDAAIQRLDARVDIISAKLDQLSQAKKKKEGAK